MFSIVNIFFIILTLTSCTKDDDNGGTNPDPDPKPPVAAGHYRNPIFVDQEVEAIGGEGIADPSTFRWMGKYYLLTTQYYKNNPGYDGFKIWESTDLVDWKYKTAIDVKNFAWDVLWAPEMYFYRGSFYIYLSGPGGKMAVLKNELPNGDSNTDPFGENSDWRALSHDFLQLADHAIDGSILIEANGDKYAFFSGMHGVKYRKINSMEDGNGGSVTQLTQCSVENIDTEGQVGDKGWTESPTAFKMNGKYYLTYTGNHYLRPDYQVHLAVGNSLESLTPISNNPWISRVYGDWTGTGNSYPILGPNLKDYYYTYHAKSGYRISPADQILRALMLDKVEFKDNGILTKAPTFDDEPIPLHADYENSLASGLDGFTKEGSASWTPLDGFAIKVVAPELWGHRIYSNQSTKDDFVAEATMRMSDFVSGKSSKVAFIQGATSQDPNLLVGLEYSEGVSKLVIYDNKNQWRNINLPEFNVNDWTDLRIEKNGSTLTIYVNNIEVSKSSIDDFKGSSIGYMAESCTAEVSWLAFSNI